jgi:SAM-dependent methyltransferase
MCDGGTAAMIVTQHTPGCSDTERALFSATDRNRRVGGGAFDYVRCDRCGVIRLANPPADLSAYYPDTYYALPTAERLAAIASRDPFKIGLVGRFSQPGRLLEIGPAFGTFAFQAKQAGYQVSAIEMDARCCTYLDETLGIKAIRSDAPHEVMASLGPQNVIALWHVIEHLPDPWSLIRAAARNLAPGGILVLATPNPLAWQFGVMGPAWPHVDAPRHLYLLPAASVSAFAGQHGLAVVHCDDRDRDVLQWNRFGWQRLVMNLVPDNKWTQRAAFVAGTALSVPMMPFDRRAGSAYTLVLQKAG